MAEIHISDCLPSAHLKKHDKERSQKQQAQKQQAQMQPREPSITESESDDFIPGNTYFIPSNTYFEPAQKLKNHWDEGYEPNERAELNEPCEPTE